jgi:hypothetical protein
MDNPIMKGEKYDMIKPVAYTYPKKKKPGFPTKAAVLQAARQFIKHLSATILTQPRNSLIANTVVLMEGTKHVGLVDSCALMAWTRTTTERSKRSDCCYKSKVVD